MTARDRRGGAARAPQDTLRRHGISASKSLGQNFLVDRGVVVRIAECAGIGAGDLVIEIGAGTGVLTVEAAERAARVVAIEIDRKLLPALGEAVAGKGNVSILNEDALKTDFRALAGRSAADADARRMGAAGVKIIGNLPYYITSAIIAKLLGEGAPAESMTFMMQSEVADRICAEAGGKGCGAITALVRYHCEPRLMMRVPREAFRPVPKVDSAVVRLDVRKERAVSPASEEIFFAAVRAGFGQRRKTLRNSLAGLAGMSKDEAAAALAAAGIDPSRRAETLCLEEFAAVADAVAGMARQPFGLDGGIAAQSL
ncbi:MAG: 16S rRNA (adenine(1518)-N(6)/adenine(1519)-N(6))-dimethyltransferase RsmA [Clostridiales Family XIII bacterium]|jgi:16S rRNA (adenine1518-N6/adenine1519-N6)-dimethyltransferase|nr:16S rRNA (adenine(1518)-N(6)/adenine(1519)-N(6))-dimethyltransferase RsmA [Clostridiales Family XIII bacterium]